MAKYNTNFWGRFEICTKKPKLLPELSIQNVAGMEKAGIQYYNQKNEHDDRIEEICALTRILPFGRGYKVLFPDGVSDGTTIKTKTASIFPNFIANWLYGESQHTMYFPFQTKPLKLHATINHEGKVPIQTDEGYLRQKPEIGGDIIYGDIEDDPLEQINFESAILTSNGIGMIMEKAMGHHYEYDS